MQQAQKIVGMGAASGDGVGVWLLTDLLPQPSVADAPGDRIAYAPRANVVALVPFSWSAGR